MHDVTLVILNSLRIKCHIRRPLISALATMALKNTPSDEYDSYREYRVG